MAGQVGAPFYLARVDEARREAEISTLDHVRERCLRSMAAWQALAVRAERGQATRDKLALTLHSEPLT